ERHLSAAIAGTGCSTPGGGEHDGPADSGPAAVFLSELPGLPGSQFGLLFPAAVFSADGQPDGERRPAVADGAVGISQLLFHAWGGSGSGARVPRRGRPARGRAGGGDQPQVVDAAV